MTRSATLALAALVLGGCKPPASSEEADAGPTGTPVPEQVCTPSPGDTFCPAYADAFCAAHFACCGDPSAKYDTMERCLERTTCLCTAHRQGAAPTSGVVTLDVAAGDALVAKLRAAPGTCPTDGAAPLDLDAVFRGSLAEGASCAPTATDFSSLYACAPGLTCFLTDFGDTTHPAVADCRRPRVTGESCDGSMLCAAGAYCAAGANVDDPGTCAPLLTAGASCDGDYECASDACTDAGVCAPVVADDVYCVDASTTT